MSGTARSQTLIQWHSDVVGPSPIWRSPDNFVTLVKSLHVWSPTAATAQIILQVGNNTGVGPIAIALVDLGTNTPYEWNGWYVLNPGDFTYVYCGAVAVNVWLSGAVLAGGPQFPVAQRNVTEQLPNLPDAGPR